MSGRHVGSAALLAALGCLLAGCAEPAAPASSGGLPVGLPSAVPVRSGTVLAASGGTEWRFVVRSEAVHDDFVAERDALNAAGFSTTYDNEGVGGDDGQFCDARYCIDLSAYDDPAYGPSLGYEVYRNSGLLPPA